MLRRVARALRVALVALGFGLLVWWPLSHVRGTVVQVPLPETNGCGFRVELGVARIAVDFTGPRHRLGLSRFRLFFSPPIDPQFSDRLEPSFDAKWSHGNLRVAVPLWLLAFLCLAWPVTSFIIARRRRKGRGFEVEPAGTSNIEHPTSNIEAP